ncbi:MAG: glycogen synthase GlgA [candidate division Zixibacteria bacterium]|nr:glycogen synthase GlgA [candidate division Zixibacteria bacterium]
MKKLNILFASSEVVPFAKTGGLADVSGMLPRVLANMGHFVKVFMPKYGTIDKSLLKNAHKDLVTVIPMSDGPRTLELYRISDNNLDYDTHFIGNDFYFGRPELYRDTKTGKDFVDNDDRFIFFCRGILEVLKKIDFVPDIIHANDWQTALLPTFLKTKYVDDKFFAQTKSIFTIHNLAYQGLFPAKSFVKLGLDKKLFYATGPFEFWDKLNLMKSAIHYADKINTVSETYAKEIQSSEELGAGLQGVLTERKKDVSGIINGVDYQEWSPSKDKLIPHKFSSVNLSGKRMSKIELMKRIGLPDREHIPLIGMISRLADQKGFDLVREAGKNIMQLDIQMIILGTGEEKYHKWLVRLQDKHPDKLKVLLKYDNELAHWIEAAADIFLMPSRYEPCGLNQLYSLKYGTIPIVRKTGGLADTIENADFDTGIGTGLVFEDYDSKEMLAAIKYALPYYMKKRKWRKIMKNGMEKDYSWSASAEKYIELYKKTISSG